MRAVRALRAALDALLAGFLDFLPALARFPVRAVFLAPAAVADFAGFPPLAGFPALGVFPALAGAADATGFFALCALEEAELDGEVVELLEDCPASGNATISKVSRPARRRKTGRKTGIGEYATLIFSL